MKIIYITIIFYLGYSVLIALMAYFIAKHIEEHPNFLNINWKKGKKIRLFFLKYPWLVGIIVFLMFLLFNLLSYLGIPS
jgi:hypothetical protein